MGIDMKNFFVDAETDGLYGSFLSIAAMVTDERGTELDRFYASVKISPEQIETEWVKENVYPELKNADIHFDNELEMLDAFWTFWIKYRVDSICITNVQYPVESRLFTSCVMMDKDERTLLGPLPIYDLSTLLAAKGFYFDEDMKTLSGMDLKTHDAMNDVKMMAAVWNNLIGEMKFE